MRAPFLSPDWDDRAAGLCQAIEALMAELQAEADRRSMPAEPAATAAPADSLWPIEDSLAALQVESRAAGEQARKALARLTLAYRQIVGLRELTAPPAADPDAYIQTVGALLAVGVETAALVFSPQRMAEFRAGADATIAESLEFQWARWLDVLSHYVEASYAAAAAIASPGGSLRISLRQFEESCRRIGEANRERNG